MWFYVAKSGFMSAILDVRNSLSIAFLATSDRLAILDFLNSLSIAILAISDRYIFCIFFFGGHLEKWWNVVKSGEKW